MTLTELQKTYLPGVAPEDFFLLLSHATGKEKAFLLAHPELELSAAEEERVKEYLKRRLKHEPVAYITGHKEFYGRDFHVTSGTLIPRPETELLVEHALDTIRYRISALKNREEGLDIIDIGTGSGNIIITLAKEIEKMHQVSDIRYHALDISPRALAVARENALHHHIDTRITFIESDLLQNVSVPQEKNRHAIIAANLPYLSAKIYQESDADVRDHEPPTALVSGTDGLDHYRSLLQMLPAFSRHFLSTTLFLEISPEQSEALPALIIQALPEANIQLFMDLAGKDRLIQATIEVSSKLS